MIKLRNMASIFILHESKVLLLYRIGSKVITTPKWCGIGGHFEKEELNDPLSCILRELKEETGITENDICNLRLKYVTLRIQGDEIRQNYYYFADLLNSAVNICTCDEGKLEWINIHEALEKEMPFSAKYCFKHYFKTGKNDDKVYAGIATGDSGVLMSLDEF